MATQKEKDALMELVSAALEVNQSSERVDVTVDIHASGANIRISDPVEVAAAGVFGSWDWLFYQEGPIYFSNDVFDEETFLDRCRDLTTTVLSFKNRQAPSEEVAN